MLDFCGEFRHLFILGAGRLGQQLQLVSILLDGSSGLYLHFVVSVSKDLE